MQVLRLLCQIFFVDPYRRRKCVPCYSFWTSVHVMVKISKVAYIYRRASATCHRKLAQPYTTRHTRTQEPGLLYQQTISRNIRWNTLSPNMYRAIEIDLSGNGPCMSTILNSSDPMWMGPKSCKGIIFQLYVKVIVILLSCLNSSNLEFTRC
jgi:hypothetical protein